MTKPAIPWHAKFQAFGAHLAISVLVFAIIISLTVWLWYPPPFFWIDGGVQVVTLAALIDLLAGPLLTFVVFRPGKRGLTMNLAVIAAVQCAALTWGVQALYSQRPVLMAFVPHKENRFYPITEAQVRDGARTLEELEALSPHRPAMVFINLPEDDEKAASLLRSTVTSVLRHTERFGPVDAKHLARIALSSRTTKVYEHGAPEFARGIERFEAKHRGGGFAYIPLYGRFGYALLAISKSDGRVAGVVAKEINWH